MNTHSAQWVEPATHDSSPNIRIMQLDVLRGFAVLGIYWINIIIFALPSGSYYLPILSESLNIPDFLGWSFTEIFIEGTMRGLFSILFGASAMVFLNEAKLAHQGLDIVDRYYRRSLLLILFGIIHSYLLLWPYDVLYAYGLLGLFLFPLRKVSSRLLIIGGCVLLLSSHVNLFNSFTNLFSADSFLPNSIEQVNQTASEPATVSPDEIKQLIDENMESGHYLSSYTHIFNYQFDDVIEQHSSTMYTQHVFDIGGMMLIGMALLKLGILSGQRSRRFYLVLLTSGYLVGTIFRAIGIYFQLKYDFDLFENKSHGGIDYDIGRLPITLGHIGLIGLLCQSLRLKSITNALTAVGRLALTNYIMQTLISIFLFYGFGFALYGKLNQAQLIFTCIAVWSFQITFSISWLHFFKFGPLEWLWRSLIYGKRQPLKVKNL